MSDDWPARFTKQALAKVDTYLAEHPQWTRQGVQQPYQGSTNRVVFARCGEEIIVFKVFCETERKDREYFGLRHWQKTGLVPSIIGDTDAAMLIITHIPGMHLHLVKETEGAEVWLQACQETGKALGLLTRVLLSREDRADFEARFYRDTPTLEAYLGRIYHLGRAIHARDPDFRGVYWKKSLDMIEAEWPGILAQPSLLYHQDASNLHVRQGRFMGFYDLEMCRVGCAAMQLASSLGMLTKDPEGWIPFRAGWETATGALMTPADFRTAAAAFHLLCWREISRYMSYDGTPGTGYGWAEPADPVRYRHEMDAVGKMLDV